ncbi:FAD-linked oxidoreductase sor8 [Paramyrothecium foliicola]|nr:FAD-linked oxidoreductase sor8 [Paramyrothecium foliicola]
MAPVFTNNSCNPFSDPGAHCTLGNYPVYSINATGARDYQVAVDFARRRNIRLVIRNTGHDYNGKSTGAASLALWTHHMKVMKLTSFRSRSYSGKAFQFGAGVLGIEAYRYADSRGFSVVGPNQPSVGIVGGYTQGGGHGPFASRYGLAADQVLEWEVVLASGKVAKASRDSPEHASLYWALCGGGGGAFAAVVSVTVKAHPIMAMSTANLSFLLPSEGKTGEDVFYQGVEAFNKHVLSLSDAGTVAVWFIATGSFTLDTVFAPGLKQKELDTIMSPLLQRLTDLKIEHKYSSIQHASFLSGFSQQNAVNVANLNIGGRLIPRSLIKNNLKGLTAAVRNITSQGAVFSGVSFDVSQHAPDSIGANPQWREAAFNAVVGFPFDWANWDLSLDAAGQITDSILPQLERLTPGGAVYLNEADFQQPDWSKAFYGTHWKKLSEVKEKYDPLGIFYSLGAVGSQKWAQQRDGALCRV